ASRPTSTSALVTLSLHDALPICLAVGIDHAVVVGRGVVGERDIEELVLLTVRIEERSHDLRHVLRIPGERHLLALCLGLEPLERSEEHTSELQSLAYLVCRLLLE